MPTDKEMLDWLDRHGRHYKWNVQLETDWPCDSGKDGGGG